MGRRGRVAYGGQCLGCAHLYWRSHDEADLRADIPSPERKAEARASAVTWVGFNARYPGTAIHLAITENA